MTCLWNLKQVSKWIAMAYPTWLIFLRNDTSFEDFLEEVYVPFNCVLMVTRTDTEGHGEIVKDVYRISREDDLKWMEFGVWDPEQGFRGPRKGLYQRRHDLHGLNLRVISIHVREMIEMYYPDNFGKTPGGVVQARS